MYRYPSSEIEYFLPCGDIDTPARNGNDLALCSCDEKSSLPTPCWWFPYFVYPDDTCIALVVTAVEPYNASADLRGADCDVYPFNDGNVCRPTSPSGTFELSVTGLVLALGSQLVEAVVGFKY